VLIPVRQWSRPIRVRGEGQDIHVDLRKVYISQSAWQDTLAD
jgi:hypothetical protein